MRDRRFAIALLVTAGALPALLAGAAIALDQEPLLLAAIALAVAYVPAAWLLHD